MVHFRHVILQSDISELARKMTNFEDKAHQNMIHTTLLRIYYIINQIGNELVTCKILIAWIAMN